MPARCLRSRTATATSNTAEPASVSSSSSVTTPALSSTPTVPTVNNIVIGERASLFCECITSTDTLPGSIVLIIALFAVTAIGTVVHQARQRRHSRPSLPRSPFKPSRHIRSVSSGLSASFLVPELKGSLQRSFDILTRTTSKHDTDGMSIRSSTSSFAAPFIVEGDTIGRPPRVFSLQGRSWHDVEREAQKFTCTSPTKRDNLVRAVTPHQVDAEPARVPLEKQPSYVDDGATQPCSLRE